MCFGGHTHDLLQRPAFIETWIGATNIARRASTGIPWPAACSENARHNGIRSWPLEVGGPLSSGQYLVPWNVHQHPGNVTYTGSYSELCSLNVRNVLHSIVSPRKHCYGCEWCYGFTKQSCFCSIMSKQLIELSLVIIELLSKMLLHCVNPNNKTRKLE